VLLINGVRKQFAIRKQDFADAETFKALVGECKIGTIVTVCGVIELSSTKVPTLFAKEITFHQHSLHGFPDKWNGITDEETKRRHRFLDCIMDQEVSDRFVMRSRMMAAIRSFMASYNYMEVETPILSKNASGAMARPFKTHYNALDTDFYLRIAPETYLKRMVAAGYDKVFEIGKNFRNEGMDPSHLQEFTFIEWYWAFANYMDNLDFFREMISHIIHKTINSTEIDYQGTKIVFGNQMEVNDWPIVTYKNIFMQYTNIDPFTLTEKEADTLFKTKVRPNLIQPMFVIDYPAFMSPMAKRKDSDPSVVEQWQFIVNGWELVKCYTELTDPVLQRTLLEEQMKAKQDGDEETMDLEEDFLYTLEMASPPMSGAGIGLDRLLCLLTNQTSLRDAVFFPAMV